MPLADRAPSPGTPGPTGALVSILDGLAVSDPAEYRVCYQMLEGLNGWVDAADVAVQLSEEFGLEVSAQMVRRWRSGASGRGGHPKVLPETPC